MHKWLMLLSIISLSAAAERVYTWTDAEGQVHYSDRPVPGAREIELHVAATPAAPPSSQAAPATSTPAPNRPAPSAYTAFNVVQPSQQQTLWNIEGNLDVTLELTPALQPGHHIGVYLDGQLQDLDTTSLQFTVPNVYRGIHTLQAVVLDSSGKEVVRSLAVTFMVQQTSILNPNNPNFRPRPNAGPGAGSGAGQGAGQGSG